jgi:hypothetical protein
VRNEADLADRRIWEQTIGWTVVGKPLGYEPWPPPAATSGMHERCCELNAFTRATAQPGPPHLAER